MKVLVILAYEDVAHGNPSATAIVQFPDGSDPDDVFCTWLAKRPEYEGKNRSREYLLEQPYVWHVMEVEKI